MMLTLSRNRVARLATIAIATLTLGTAAVGQTSGGRQEMIPVELVEALLSGPGPAMRSLPPISAGKLSPELERSVFVPTSARVIGAGPAIYGMMMLGVMVVPLTVDSARTLFTREETRMGWKLQPESQDAEFGGFRPAKVANAMNPLIFCHQSTMLALDFSRTNRDSTLVRASLVSGPAGMGTGCVTRETGQTELPGMFNPAIENADPYGCSHPSGSSSTSVPLKTGMSASALLEHYARQVPTSAWGTAPSTDIVGRMWTLRDSSGTRQLALTVYPGSTPGCREVKMEVKR